MAQQLKTLCCLCSGTSSIPSLVQWLRFWPCHNSGTGRICDLDSIPGLGTSMCRRYSQKEKKKNNHYLKTEISISIPKGWPPSKSPFLGPSCLGFWLPPFIYSANTEPAVCQAQLSKVSWKIKDASPTQKEFTMQWLRVKWTRDI